MAFGLVKGERPEWAVQKLTEVGVDVIVPMATDRSVVRWDAAKAARQHDRLGTIAREAAMQCRRAWLPEISPLTTPVQLAQRPGVAMAQHGGGPLTSGTLLVMVGPEGGWSEAESDLAVPVGRTRPTCVARRDGCRGRWDVDVCTPRRNGDPACPTAT